MGKNDLLGRTRHFATSYSDTVKRHIANPTKAGLVDSSEAASRGCIVATAHHIGSHCGDEVTLYLCVEIRTKIVRQARFQCFGCEVAIAAADITAELCEEKALDEVLRLCDNDIEMALRDYPHEPAMPPEKMNCSIFASSLMKKMERNCSELGLQSVESLSPDLHCEYNVPSKEEIADIFSGGVLQQSKIVVAVEKPLEISVNEKVFAVTMRTPEAQNAIQKLDSDLQLAAGFCFTEGIINNFSEDCVSVTRCASLPPGFRVVVKLSSDATSRFSEMNVRHTFKALSSCGLCGKTSSEEIQVPLSHVMSSFTLSPPRMQNQMKIFEENQKIYVQTRAVHAVGIFDAEAKLISFAEDVGRHNAFDKAIGALLMEHGNTKRAVFVILSSRTSFEMMQKAIRAGIPIVAGVSAPTSQAISLARYYNITLIGRWRGTSFITYTNPHRITFDEK